MAKKKTTKTSARKTASTRKASASRKPAPKKKKPKPAPKKSASTGKKTKTKKKTVTKKKTAARTSKKKPVTKKKTTSKSKASGSKVKKKVTEKKAPKPEVEIKKKKTVKPKKPPLKPGQVKITKGRSVLEVATGAVADEHGYVMVNGRRVRMISTKGLITTTKKSRSKKKVAEVEVIQKPTKPKPIKTKLGKKELDHYKNLLMIKRAEIVGDLTTIEAEALRSNDGDLSNMPIHMADIGSDTYEQDFMLGMAESERQRLREIDEALMRIQNRTYGVCQMTGKTIPTARLEAKPWAKYTIEAARKLEGQWGA